MRQTMNIHPTPSVIIFDLDGTLLDSMPFWDGLALSALTQHSLEPDEELLRRLPEMTMREAADYQADHYPVLGTADDIFAAWGKRAREAFQNKLPYKPGALELLADLKSRGKKIAIATMSERAIVKLALQRQNVGSMIDTLVTFEDVGVGKHEPAIWLEITRRFNVAPSECIVIEDAYFAARTAKAAGFRVIGVNDAANAPHATHLQEVSDLYVDSLEELIGQL
ncbi:MAG: HAD family phosphatase [Clostridia bacterium]|nr:HAD family phosphatase [Clostridia bacterium]